MVGSDFHVRELGPRRVLSPLAFYTGPEGEGGWVSDDTRIPLNAEISRSVPPDPTLSFEKAGPRERLYFSPENVRAAIVTCGGLAPGLNNVIRSAVMQLTFGYSVKRVLGIRYGYQGMHLDAGMGPLELNPDAVSRIHTQGGTILGTSRGPGELPKMVDFLRHHGINMLFTVGGDGTQRGAHALYEECRRQEYPLALVGIPKTIDNDISYVFRSFGFATAMEVAAVVIASAHNEARGHFHGVGLVKLMGREAGFIAAAATLANQDVNFTLIPEIPFELEGEGGFLCALQNRLEQRGHAVVVVAEGAGQDLLGKEEARTDASGNVVLKDIGLFLRDRIRDYFRKIKGQVDVKYFDPSYLIRSTRANAADAIFCDQFARSAVHAAMAGKTDIVVGLWYNVMTHVPIPLILLKKKRLSPTSGTWQAVLKVTGQPVRFTNAAGTEDES